jgi:lysophospholipase L1-like esterase
LSRLLRFLGTFLILIGITCNQWTLSFFFPEDGFHISNVLEKHSGKWDLPSLALIWAVEAAFLVLGVIIRTHYKSPRRIFLSTSVLATSTFLSLLVFEGIVRVASRPNLFSSELPLRPHNNLEKHVDLHGVSPIVHNTTNQWGLRGDEPPKDWKGSLTVVVIGGSTAQCFYLDDHKTWPYLLQEKLKASFPKIWVGNGGLSGHSTRGHIIFVRKVIAKLKPRLAILLVGVNDLGFSMNDQNRKYGNPAERTGWRRFLFDNSRIVQLASLWKRVLIDDAPVLDRGSNSNYVPETLDREIELPDNLLMALPGLDEYRENIRTIISDLRSLNVTPLFLTQPLLFDSTKEWQSVVGREYSGNGKKGFVSAATFARMLNIYNKELIRICQADSVAVLNVASKIPHNTEYFYDLMHFTEKGADKVAEEIARFVQANGLVENRE